MSSIPVSLPGLHVLVKVLIFEPGSEEELWPNSDGCTLSIGGNWSEEVSKVAVGTLALLQGIPGLTLLPLGRTAKLLNDPELRAQARAENLKAYASVLYGTMCSVARTLDIYDEAIRKLVEGDGDEATHRKSLDSVGRIFRSVYGQLQELHVRKWSDRTWHWFRDLLNTGRAQGERVPLAGIRWLLDARKAALRYDRRDRLERLVSSKFPWGGLNRLVVWLDKPRESRAVKRRVMEEIGDWFCAVEKASTRQESRLTLDLFHRYLPYILSGLPAYTPEVGEGVLVERVEWAMKKAGATLFDEVQEGHCQLVDQLLAGTPFKFYGCSVTWQAQLAPHLHQLSNGQVVFALRTNATAAGIQRLEGQLSPLPLLPLQKVYGNGWFATTAPLRCPAVKWPWGGNDDQAFYKAFAAAFASLTKDRPKGKLEELLWVTKDLRVCWVPVEERVTLNPAEVERFVQKCSGRKGEVAKRLLKSLDLTSGLAASAIRQRIVEAVGGGRLVLEAEEEDAKILLKGQLVEARLQLGIDRKEDGALLALLPKILEELQIITWVPDGVVRDALIRKYSSQ